jgi:hypothetical protein
MPGKQHGQELATLQWRLAAGRLLLMLLLLLCWRC